jgi:hypothetical protein
VRGPQATRSDDADPRFQNLAQGMKIMHPDHAWVNDIIDVRLRKKLLYLPVFMDL